MIYIHTYIHIYVYTDTHIHTYIAKNNNSVIHPQGEKMLECVFKINCRRASLRISSTKIIVKA